VKKKKLRMKKTARFLVEKGFTLVELLIVIAVLGILAVAVLSAINPIEQINRSRDTGKISDAEQLINAMDRYYTSKGYYVWCSSAASCGVQDWQSVDDTWQDDANVAVLDDKLAAGGAAEIKASFATRLKEMRPPMQVYNRGNQGDSTYVCFLPQSADFREKSWNRCKGDTPDDYPPDACPADNCVNAANAADATRCYYCVP
jgi:prepilin-type N-terminal cleavage/methylation domain-containing protein